MVIVSPNVRCDYTSVFFNVGFYLCCYRHLHCLSQSLDVPGYGCWIGQNLFNIKFSVFCAHTNNMLKDINKTFPCNYIIRPNVFAAQTHFLIVSCLMCTGRTVALSLTDSWLWPGSSMVQVFRLNPEVVDLCPLYVSTLPHLQHLHSQLTNSSSISSSLTTILKLFQMSYFPGVPFVL